SQWKAAHPGLAPIYEKLGLFSVFNSVWFSAIYLLLMVSLIGCILPRSTVYLRTLRAAPPRAPRNLARLPAYVAVESDEAPAVLAGQGFSSSLAQYDDFAPGSLFEPASLMSVSLTVDSFKARCLTAGRTRSQPVEFGAGITYRDTPSSPARKYHLAVNAPVTL